MIIALASDHAGYEMKMAIKEKLEKEGYEILDLGTDSTESVDYPIYGKAIGEAVAQGKAERVSPSAARASAFPSQPTR